MQRVAFVHAANCPEDFGANQHAGPRNRFDFQCLLRRGIARQIDAIGQKWKRFTDDPRRGRQFAATATLFPAIAADHLARGQRRFRVLVELSHQPDQSGRFDAAVRVEQQQEFACGVRGGAIDSGGKAEVAFGTVDGDVVAFTLTPTLVATPTPTLPR